RRPGLTGRREPTCRIRRTISRGMGAHQHAPQLHASGAWHPAAGRSPAFLQPKRLSATVPAEPTSGVLRGQPMKLAFFGHKPRAGEKGGGLYSYSLEILRGLRGRDVDVVFLYHGPRTRKRSGAKEIQLGSVNLFNKDVIAVPKALSIIKETLASERPDVAHASLS